MGSTTKMFTAVSVLRLAEKGVISLDQKIAPLVDKYLTHRLPCNETPAHCAKSCWPIVACLGGQTDGVCTDVRPKEKAACSDCIRHLHCHCDGTACPSALTLKM